MSDNTQLSVGTEDGVIIAGAEVTFSGDTALVQAMGTGLISGSAESYTYTLCAGGAGAVSAGVQRVTLASDDPAVADLAAIEVLLTAANVDHAANEVLLTSIDADTGNILTDTNAMVVDLAAIEVLLGTIDTDTGALVTDLAAIEVLLTAANVDHAANEVLLTAIDTSCGLIEGKITACNTGAVVISSGTITTVSAVTAITNALPAGDNNIGNVDIASSLPAGTNAIGKLAANSGVDIGDVDVTSISAGSNLIGDVGIQGRTTGGLSIFYDMDLDETAVVVKAAAGTLYAMHVINTTDAPLYLQLFDVAQGSVTVGTTTPTVQFIIPGNADSDGAGFTFSVPQGIAFSTAITAACSTDNEGNSAPAANACHCNLFYK